MQAPWNPSFQINMLDGKWDDMPSKPGIYVIKCKKAIPRAATPDPNGILYIGKSLKVRNRLCQFWYAQHPASGFLWSNRKPKCVSVLLGVTCRNEKDVENCLGQLFVKQIVSRTDRMLRS